MKCKGCLFRKVSVYVDVLIRGCKLELVPDNCHLTPASFARIKAEIAGEYDCGHCMSYSTCKAYRTNHKLEMSPDWWPCAKWQPKGGYDRTLSDENPTGMPDFEGEA